MKTPFVAIVGRPNVGKSSLFNTLSGKRTSIVSDEAGVTRDRITATVEWAGTNFTLVDTGGVDFDESNAFAAHIREQVDIAIDLADVIIFLLDGESGITPADLDISNMLRKCKKPIVVAVNKLDNDKRDGEVYDFFRLKLGEPVGISCTQKRGIGDLLDAVTNNFTKEQIANADAGEPMRICIIGRPNAGKSSITNKILGEKRVMVSEIAGTTRDSIDTPFNWNGKPYILTDTAGVRRKRSVEVQTVEHYSVLRALSAIRSSDVCVVVIDSTDGITEQDVRLASYIHNEGKPSVIVVNKWDIAGENYPKEKSHLFLEWQNKLATEFAHMAYIKAVFTSALTGQRINEIMVAVNEVFENSRRRITTGKLNQMFLDFVATNPTRAKIKYATQVGVNPPTFALFVSKKQHLPPTYERYLENCLRKAVNFIGTPIKIYIRENTGKGGDEQ
jgi:GTP-binding protein